MRRVAAPLGSRLHKRVETDNGVRVVENPTVDTLLRLRANKRRKKRRVVIRFSREY